MASRRILYHFVAPLERTVGPEEPARRCQFLNSFADTHTTIDVASPEYGRNSIESAWDAALVGPAIIDGLLAAEEDGCDAVIVGCFSDPVLDAAREALTIPVIGPGSAAVHFALQLGDRIGVIAPGSGAAGRTRAFFRSMGLEDRLASVRGMGLSVPELAASMGSPAGRVAEAAQACVDEDGADVVVLGCMSMAFVEPIVRLDAELGVPLVNPVVAAVKSAELAVLLGLSQSRVRWPKAQAKPVYSLSE